MRRLLINSLLLICCLGISRVQAQEATEQEESVRQAIEFLSENLDQQADFTDITDWLNYYYEHPLDVNTASREELQQLYLLSAQQIESLLLHREQLGPLISIYELQAVDNLDLQSIQRILPFIKVAESSGEQYTFKQALTQGQHNLALRYTQLVERQQGYRDANPQRQYLGSPYALQLRYEYKLGSKLSYGLVADKDAGEQFFRGHEKQGFDFYSAHLFYSGSKHLKSLALGDYQVQIGQGLTMWSAFAFGKTAEVMNVARIPRGIFASRSTNAFMFLRGAAASFGFGHWGLTAFASRKRLDANVLKDTLTEEEYAFSSLLLSGYHRNLSELEDRNSVTETLGGAELKYRVHALNIGLCAVYGGYGLGMQKENIASQSSFFNAGLNYTWLYKNAYFFGELAWNGKAAAGISGVLLTLHPSLDAGIVYRNYSRQYSGPYVNGFGEGGQSSNEHGTYLAMSYKPSGAWKINAYADFFSSPWLRYRVDAPSVGQDFLVYVTYEPSKSLQAYVRFRVENKEQNVTDISKMSVPALHSLQHWRMQIQYRLNDAVALRSRAELSQYREENGTPQPGFLIFQDIDFRAFKRLNISARYTFFDISSYNARIYTYEDDMQYSFSIPSFQNQGIRCYLMAKYHWRRGPDLAFRIARTRFYDVDVIGSGGDKINMPHKTEVKLMLGYKF